MYRAELLDYSVLDDRLVTFSKQDGIYSLEVHDKETGKSIELHTVPSLGVTHEPEKQIGALRTLVPAGLVGLVLLTGAITSYSVMNAHGGPAGVVTAGLFILGALGVAEYSPSQDAPTYEFNEQLSRYCFSNLELSR